jgi:hypothetical protein
MAMSRGLVEVHEEIERASPRTPCVNTMHSLMSMPEPREREWKEERKHLQGQMQREQATMTARKQAMAAEAKRRRARLESSWKGEDDNIATKRSSQLGIAVQEQSIRNSDDATEGTLRGLRHDGHVSLMLGNRDFVEKRDEAADVLSRKHGAKHWQFWNEHGAKEYAMEQREGKKGMVHAVRGFRFAKDDEAHDAKIDATGGTARLTATRLVGTRLPTAPDKGGHGQSAGLWRTETLSMTPGAWRHNQTDSQVERAKTASWRAHNAHVEHSAKRSAAVTAYISGMDALDARVSDARLGPWRHKVDTATSSTHATSFWPDKGTHRAHQKPEPLNLSGRAMRSQSAR